MKSNFCSNDCFIRTRNDEEDDDDADTYLFLTLACNGSVR